jgi:nucleotide-binding universal stress UspA family protein
MIKCILVGIGGTPFTHVAIQRAIELAKRHGAIITGVTVVDIKRLQQVGPVPPGASAYAEKLRKMRTEITEERIETAVAEFERKCKEANITFKVERESGDPFQLMISHARYNDVTIFGLRSLFDYGFTPEPKDALIRLVSHGVRPIIAVSTEFRVIRSALIAYSGSMESAKAMRRFVQSRLWPDVSLRIAYFGEKNEGSARRLEAAREYCLTHGFETEIELVAGSAKNGLIPYAQKHDLDIVVLGNSIRSLLMRHLLGDTVLNTIQSADRPLFLAQ